MISNGQRRQGKLGLALGLSVLFAAVAFAKAPLVPKWDRFEETFKSSADYENPFQQCSLKVTFLSPNKETYVTYGFWDGGKTWRVRFSPDMLGRWTYKTSCSDASNKGLNAQSGEFTCTPSTDQGRFAQHGPIRVARDHVHFEHSDGSPFFWMADVAWNAPRLSDLKDWATYTQIRSNQNFSAVEWAVAPGSDAKQHSAFSGKGKLTIDPEYFQKLDAKVDTMNHAGLLSVIAPLWGDGDTMANLSEDQVALLVRYMTARWGANDVAWLLSTENRSARWQRIGRDVFGRMRHAPVIIFTGELAADFDDFRKEAWVDAFGFGVGQNVNDDSLKWLVSGPIGREWIAQPGRPLLNVLPPLENAPAAQGQRRITDNDVRRVAWWSLLLVPPAGVSYGANDVANWNAAKQDKLPIWHLSLFLPGAKQMSHVAEFLKPSDWRSLRPAWRTVAVQPGNTTPRRFIAASQSEAKDFSLVYVPEDRTLEVFLASLPPSPGIQWFNPRTGQKSAAVAVVGAQACQLPTPDPGDWVLVMKSGK